MGKQANDSTYKLIDGHGGVLSTVLIHGGRYGNGIKIQNMTEEHPRFITRNIDLALALSRITGYKVVEI